MAKAADAFLTGRPYGIRLDFKHKGFALFNYNMNELGNHLPGRLETLPLEDFDVEDIPLCGERIVRKENITDIFFYDEKSNPYSDNRVDMKKLKAYNKYIYPLSLIYNPQIQISAESETKRSIFREKDKTKRSKKESAQHSKSRNKSFVMTSVSAL